MKAARIGWSAWNYPIAENPDPVGVAVAPHAGSRPRPPRAAGLHRSPIHDRIVLAIAIPIWYSVTVHRMWSMSMYNESTSIKLKTQKSQKAESRKRHPSAGVISSWLTDPSADPRPGRRAHGPAGPGGRPDSTGTVGVAVPTELAPTAALAPRARRGPTRTVKELHEAHKS